MTSFDPQACASAADTSFELLVRLSDRQDELSLTLHLALMEAVDLVGGLGGRSRREAIGEDSSVAELTSLLVRSLEQMSRAAPPTARLACLRAALQVSLAASAR